MFLCIVILVLIRVGVESDCKTKCLRVVCISFQCGHRYIRPYRHNFAPAIRLLTNAIQLFSLYYREET
jgi:hypothetical protein